MWEQSSQMKRPSLYTLSGFESHWMVQEGQRRIRIESWDTRHRLVSPSQADYCSPKSPSLFNFGIVPHLRCAGWKSPSQTFAEWCELTAGSIPFSAKTMIIAPSKLLCHSMI